MAAIWYCGENPPDDTRLLWIRTGEGFGNGVLYYYSEDVTGMTNVYENHWVPWLRLRLMNRFRSFVASLTTRSSCLSIH